MNDTRVLTEDWLVQGYERFVESEIYADETARQQAYTCNTIEKGWKEVKTSIHEGKPLKSADDLLSELKSIC